MAHITPGQIQQLEVLVKDLEAKESAEVDADTAKSQADSALAAAQKVAADAGTAQDAAAEETAASLKSLQDFVLAL